MAVISSDWTFQGFPLIRLENRDVRVEVLPNFGGKIWTLEHRPSQRQFLWHHPRHRLRSLPLGASYDDHFFGGFDELLPNDIPEVFEGDSLVDHGELWTTSLTPTVSKGALTLSGNLPLTPLSYHKTLTLEGNILQLCYRLENVGKKPLDLLWKLHPALCISPGAKVIVPAKLARVADPQWSRIKGTTECSWEEATTLQTVPPMEGSTEFLYLLELTEGACELRHDEEDWYFRMTFSREIFSSVWVFASFGGWRGLEVLILEPCTTANLSMNEAKRMGIRLHLPAGHVVETSVQVEVGTLRT